MATVSRICEVLRQEFRHLENFLLLLRAHGTTITVLTSGGLEAESPNTTFSAIGDTRREDSAKELSCNLIAATDTLTLVVEPDCGTWVR